MKGEYENGHEPEMEQCENGDRENDGMEKVYYETEPFTLTIIFPVITIGPARRQTLFDGTRSTVSVLTLLMTRFNPTNCRCLTYTQ